MPEQVGRPRADRVVKACSNCRERKVRCSGGSPCSDCQRLNKRCIYLPSQRRYRNRKDKRPRPTLRAQSSRNTEHCIDTNRQTSSQTPFTIDTHHQASHSQQLPGAPQHIIYPADQTLCLEPHGARNGSGIDSPSSGHAIECVKCIARGANSESTRSTDRPVSSLRSNSGWCSEPWSWKFVCSDRGSEWVSSVTGSDDFISIAKRLLKETSRDTLIDQNLMNADAPEIDEVSARSYVDAFYRNCWEAEVGIIESSLFQEKLEALSESQALESDPAWYALQNTVFAIGYRSLLARDSSVTFASAQARACPFFRRALSVFLKLLVPPPSLMSIRALTLMACYAEGLGNPGFKHFLCSNAVYLAQSHQLHRYFAEPKNILDTESITQNWLWWTIYALEKHLVTCSSRPSAIDDEHVDAQILTSMPGNSMARSQHYSISIRTARIRSQISHLLSSKAQSVPLDELTRLVTDFEHRLQGLLKELPFAARLSSLARSPHSGQRLIHTLYYQFSIYGSMIALHSPFSCPWMASHFECDEDKTPLQTQIAHSSHIVAEAAREILLALRLVNVDVTTPSWLAYDYPIHAAITLFIHVLKYPNLPTANGDLSLLDMCAGHFGYLDYLTSSQISVSLPREAAKIARKAVEAAISNSRQPISIERTPTHDQQCNASFNEALHSYEIDTHAIGLESIVTSDIEIWDDMDLNDWDFLTLPFETLTHMHPAT